MLSLSTSSGEPSCPGGSAPSLCGGVCVCVLCACTVCALSVCVFVRVVCLCMSGLGHAGILTETGDVLTFSGPLPRPPIPSLSPVNL